jgi:hypothetical protein
MGEASRSITRDDVIRILGDLDDLVVAQVVASGASVADLEEAVADLEFEVETGARSVTLSRPEVDRLRALLSDLLPEEIPIDERFPE